MPPRCSCPVSSGHGTGRAGSSAAGLPATSGGGDGAALATPGSLRCCDDHQIPPFSNRRKELKFAATDLKLNRRQQDTQIEHWGVWRENAPPKTYFLWAARLRTEARQPDKIARLIDEAEALRESYLDGAGLIAWRVRADGSGYEGVRLPVNARVTELDDTLYRIASEISRLLGPRGLPPAPVKPERRAVDVDRLSEDSADYGLASE